MQYQHVDFLSDLFDLDIKLENIAFVHKGKATEQNPELWSIIINEIIHVVNIR